MSEQVLCITKRDMEDYFSRIPNFHGICKISWIDWENFLGYETILLDRDRAESDENFKQIIPYNILVHKSEIFHYLRGKLGVEVKLHNLYSVGVGGHINDSDICQSTSLTIENGIRRELLEEVGLTPNKALDPIGIIYDPSNEVGRVHIGIVNHVLVEEKSYVNILDHALNNGGWTQIRNAKGKANQYETWSALVLKEIDL